MIGIVDVGGGLRDIYGAGIMDTLMKKGITVDYLIGVSSGSANITSYAAGQIGRNYKYYIEYSFRHQYMSFREYLLHGSFINLDYIYGTLYNSDGENPLDYPAIVSSPMQITIVATDAISGSPVYFEKNDLYQDDYGAIKASSNIPIINSVYQWRGGYYYDGGISDPIPYRHALINGCSKLVIILTRPRNYCLSERKFRSLSPKLLTKYPRATELLRQRAKLYNRQLAECLQLENEGRALVVAPEQTGNMKTLTKDRVSLQMLYEEGLRDAEKIIDFINS